VVEQNCVFQDADNKDQDAFHLMAWQNDQLVAYTRLLPKGIAYPDYASIGRVINAANVRGKGIGKQLMERSIEQLFALWGAQSIKIGAQYYLLNFYKSFGFEPVGDIYVEDNIDHIVMLRMHAK
jgi:ElaA protein